MWPEPDEEQEARIIHRTQGGNAAFHNFHNDYGHIQDPNKRRRLALAEIDKVPFGWYHVRAVAVAGIGFFTDSYDIFAINQAITTLGFTFWMDQQGVMPNSISTAIKAATSGGAVLGQIIFGILADRLGRRRIYGIELVTIIAATLAQSLSSPSTALSMAGVIIFWRVIMGVGIGGDYPMSAVITSEFAPTRWRGAMMAAVFSMQGAGQFTAAIVALVVAVGFKSSFTAANPSLCDHDCQLAADRCWRIVIGTGALPAIFALYYRITIPETPRYTFDVAKDLEKADADFVAFAAGEADGRPDSLLRAHTKIISNKVITLPRASWHDFVEYYSVWKNGSLLFATMASWFFLDLAFYGLGLNTTYILSAIGYGNGNTIYQTLINNAVGQLIIVCAGALPGYWLSILLMDTVGRRTVQIWGFAILTLLFCILGFAYDSLSQGALLALYVLAQLFFNFGPNATTFIIPGECFPTRYRSTSHGLSAASGKIGAILAQVISFILLPKDVQKGCNGNHCVPWLPHLMEIFACFMLCGTLVSFLIPETKRQTLEELAGEKPLSNRNSGSATPGSKKGGLRSPVIDPMRSPIIPPLHPKKDSPSSSNSSKRGHTRILSREVRRDSSERDPHLSGSVTSEGAILQNHGHQSPTGQSHTRTNSVNSSRYWMESIPLQDVGGLMVKGE